MAHGTIIAKRYWNTNGMQIAIVATEGGAKDVAAYIGATANAFKEEETIQWTRSHGAKLREAEARSMLPRLTERMEELGLQYRA